VSVYQLNKCIVTLLVAMHQLVPFTMKVQDDQLVNCMYTKNWNLKLYTYILDIKIISLFS